MKDKLKILYVASEVAPLVKTGGLADVAFALPRALYRQGHDVRVIIPCYGTIREEFRGERRGTCFVNIDSTTRYGAWRTSKLPSTSIPLYLIEHDGYFNRPHPYSYNGREYEDNLERFCFFCMGVMDTIPQLLWRPDIVHCNDWHTAILPAYVKTRFWNHSMWSNMPTLFTIHNIRYQGRFSSFLFPKTGLDPSLFNPDCLEFYGDINLLKAGIRFATKINTVSRTYAREIQTPAYGNGLDGFLRTRSRDLVGILNGIDYEEWNPSGDPNLPAQFSIDDLRGKQECKRQLQRELAFSERDVPLFVMVSRLVWDKGVELVAGAIERILSHDIQLAILGTGDPYYEKMLRYWSDRVPEKFRLILSHDESLAHRFYAGGDFFLMPSITEACGLSQMYALRYGTIPIVRKTGGLADTVVDSSPANILKGTATGLVFRPATPDALYRTILRALHLSNEPQVLYQIRIQGMKMDFSWERSSKEYVDLYKKAISTR